MSRIQTFFSSHCTTSFLWFIVIIVITASNTGPILPMHRSTPTIGMADMVVGMVGMVDMVDMADMVVGMVEFTARTQFVTPCTHTTMPHITPSHCKDASRFHDVL